VSARAALRKTALRLQREQRVDEILAAARTLFCEQGFEATSMAGIAARVGVVEGALYKYFESKRALLHAVLERWYEDMCRDYARDLKGVADTRGRLRLLVWRHLRAVRDDRDLCRLMFREVRREKEYHGSRLHGLNRRYTQFLMDVLVAGARNGELREDLPVPLLRDMVYGGIEHYAWNYLCGRGSLDIERTADQILGVLGEGVSRRAAPAGLQREAARLQQIVTRIERELGRPNKRQSR
jgi:AcrR family transcriptional regulator